MHAYIERLCAGTVNHGNKLSKHKLPVQLRKYMYMEPLRAHALYILYTHAELIQWTYRSLDL